MTKTNASSEAPNHRNISKLSVGRLLDAQSIHTSVLHTAVDLQGPSHKTQKLESSPRGVAEPHALLEHQVGEHY